jgi:hypothetical protein
VRHIKIGGWRSNGFTPHFNICHELNMNCVKNEQKRLLEIGKAKKPVHQATAFNESHAVVNKTA